MKINTAQELKRRTLFYGYNENNITKEMWLDAKKTMVSDFIKIVGKDEYNSLKPMIKLMFSVMDDNAPYEYALATARRLSKSTKIMILMLIMIIRLPWYNAALTVKFQNRIGKSIVPSMKATIGLMRNAKYFTQEEYTYMLSCLTQNNFTFDGRTIIFASAQSPDAALSIQATTNVMGFTGIFIHQVDDELIIEDFDKAQTVKISDEEQMRALNSITESVKRDLKAPYGASFQRVRLFNAWDFTHKYYNDFIEKNIPTGDRYKNKELKEIAQYNRNYLINPDEDNDGILIKDFHKDNRKFTVAVISYKAIPEYRFDYDNFIYTMKNDYNRWLPIYGAVPGKKINTKFTYIVKDNIKTLKEINLTKISNIYIGLDRGKRDKTALAIILKEEETNKWIFYSGCEIGEHSNELQQSKLIIIDYLKNALNHLKHISLSTLIINCDYHAYDFISALNEHAENDIDCYSIIDEKQVKTFFIEPVSLRGFWNKIGNRVDVFNDKFLDNMIIAYDNKITDSEYEITGTDMVERFESCVDNDNTGDRNEKYKANDLDMINAIEYALVEDIN